MAFLTFISHLQSTYSFAGICCGSKHHGRIHWKTDQSQWLWRIGDCFPKSCGGTHAPRESGCFGVWVDGKLSPGINSTSTSCWSTHNLMTCIKSAGDPNHSMNTNVTQTPSASAHHGLNKLVLLLLCSVLYIWDWLRNMICFVQFEFMVESVLLARDCWLKEGGMMWPSLASITLVPCEAFSDFSEKVGFWGKLYGLDFSCLQ